MTIMRAHARKLNRDVSAITSGKVKMVAQCVAMASTLAIRVLVYYNIDR